jgi:hypothetical protein
MESVDVVRGACSLLFLVLVRPSGPDRFCHSRRAENPVGCLARILDHAWRRYLSLRIPSREPESERAVVVPLEHSNRAPRTSSPRVET